jgi:hypothetical protein
MYSTRLEGAKWLPESQIADNVGRNDVQSVWLDFYSCQSATSMGLTNLTYHVHDTLVWPINLCV